MKIGQYLVSDWKHDSGIWYRIISHESYTVGYIADIRLLPFKALEPCREVEIDFLYKFPQEEYHLMFGPNAQLEFQTLELGKERIDLFLNKLSKLMLFI